MPSLCAKIRQKINNIIVLFAALLGLVACSIGHSRLPVDVVHKTDESISNLEPVWIRSDLYLRFISRQQFVVSDDSVCYISSDFGARLNCLDLASGDELWDARGGASAILATDQNRIYIGDVDLTGVYAYEGETGEIAWVKTLDVRNIGDISAVDGDIGVYASLNKFYLLDAQHGMVKESRDSTLETLPFACDESTCFYYEHTSLVALNRKNNEPLWKRDLDHKIDNHPILQDGVIVVQPSRYLGQVYAFDSLNGRFVWKSEHNVVSDVAIRNGIAYFLTDNAELMFVDISSGDIIDSVQFEPQYLDLRSNSGDTDPYFVRTSGDYLLIYFGDSWELIAYRIVD